MDEVRHLIAAALTEVKVAQDAQMRAIAQLEMALEHALQRGLQHLPAPEALPSTHRRAHLPGVPRRIEADPELRAFIEARIDRLTFEGIASDVAANFPPSRRVGRSAIHSWWVRQRGSAFIARKATDRSG